MVQKKNGSDRKSPPIFCCCCWVDCNVASWSNVLLKIGPASDNRKCVPAHNWKSPRGMRTMALVGKKRQIQQERVQGGGGRMKLNFQTLHTAGIFALPFAPRLSRGLFVILKLTSFQVVETFNPYNIIGTSWLCSSLLPSLPGSLSWAVCVWFYLTRFMIKQGTHGRAYRKSLSTLKCLPASPEPPGMGR